MQIAANCARVSGGQLKNKNMIANKTTALIAFAGEHGYGVEPDMVFEDDGHAGADFEHPGIEWERGLAAEGRIDAVPENDRLIRASAPLSSAA